VNPDAQVSEPTADFLCPLCGAPASLTMQPTEYGCEPAGECIDCNTIVEVL
jgi:hypothetical protein